MALKVIGAGFGRTGTLSMKAELERLGYRKCHHMTEVFSSAAQVDHWHAIALGETPDWDAIFEGYEASVDFPSSAYWRELAAHYPDAKVVLTLRDADSWYESARQTIWAITLAMPGWAKLLVPRARKIDTMVRTLIWKNVFDDRFEDAAHAKAVYARHIEEVKAALPPERLLVMHVKEGWGPLCAFLGHELPDTPFPRVNDTAAFQKRIRAMKMVGLLPWLVGGLAVAGGLAGWALS